MSEAYENLSKKELIAIIKRLLQTDEARPNFGRCPSQDCQRQPNLVRSPDFLFNYYTERGYFFIGRWREKPDGYGNDFGSWGIGIEDKPLDEVDEVMGRSIQFDSIDHISEYGLVIAFRDAVTKFKN